MRRVGGLWERVVSFENLCRAACRAARGKRTVACVARFLDCLEPEVLDLQRRLITGTWTPGPPSTFVIRDPKERAITVAPFEERVVHHALIDVLEPHLDRRMVFGSFACRKGKGTHAALDHAQRLVRRFAWFLKLDVRKCFPSMDHEVELATLARVVKDRDVLDLAGRIVRVGGGGGTGLPIGSLTSQWFANLVLDRLDHHVQETLRIPGYVRYMDDAALFAPEKVRLRGALAAVGEFLRERLKLALKEQATILAPATQGLPFLGWRLYARHRRRRPENRKRTWRRLMERHRQCRSGLLSEKALADPVRSVTAHLGQGNTLRLRRRWFALLEEPIPP